jgi:hypothetical protein
VNSISYSAPCTLLFSTRILSTLKGLRRILFSGAHGLFLQSEEFEHAAFVGMILVQIAAK